MTTFLQAWVRFAQQHTALYYGICLAGGLVIRWFWCGQDIWRFINPMAPLFA